MGQEQRSGSKIVRVYLQYTEETTERKAQENTPKLFKNGKNWRGGT